MQSLFKRFPFLCGLLCLLIVSLTACGSPSTTTLTPVSIPIAPSPLPRRAQFAFSALVTS